MVGDEMVEAESDLQAGGRGMTLDEMCSKYPQAVAMARERDPLWVQRVILCDLLIGRWLRGNAEKLLNRALELEKVAKVERWDLRPGWEVCLEGDVESAIGMERIAAQSEQGLVLWGERFNRRGQRPEDCDGSEGST